MMTSGLDVEEIDFFRSLKKTAIVLMLLLRLDKPVGESEIAGILDMYPTTVRNFLRSLARSGVVTRTHRYHGWTLTAGGRQMILGESVDVLLPEISAAGRVSEEASVKIETSAENSRSSGKISRSSAENSRSSVKNSRSRPLAAASLSLSFKEEKDAAAAATDPASVKNSRSNSKISRSLPGCNLQKNKNGKQRAGKRLQPDARVQANLEAFASIGVTKNDYVLEICKMKHANPAFILGHKQRLEAERRFSPGLLLTVIRCNDDLPHKYRPSKDPEPRNLISETEPEPEEEAEPVPEIEPDPSIHEPLSENGMTAMKAWSAALGQLKADLHKATYDQWVRDLMLLCARDGIFVIGTCNQYACDWLTSRLSSTIKRLLTGICNQTVEVQFVNIFGIED